jgi:tRNA-splicing endonuclease subunit Sen2
VKFGSDFILYRRGPPFSHAEFAVVVVDSKHDEPHDWWWNTSMGRVIGTVRKTLVLCYVTPPENCDFNSIKSVGDIKKLVSTFSVREIVYRRWIPTRNRD